MNTDPRALDPAFVLLLEEGARLEPGFLDAARVAFERPEVAAVCGRRRSIRPGATLFDRLADLEARERPGRLETLPPNAMVRRGALDDEDAWIVRLDVPMVAVEEKSRAIADWIRDGFAAGRSSGWGPVGRAALLLSAPFVATALSVTFGTSWPLVALPPAAAWLAYETGARESWRAEDVESRFLLGAHRWLESLPAAAGRLSRLSAATPTRRDGTRSRS